MFARNLRKATAAACALAVLVAVPGQASACCFWRSPTTAYYAPAPVVAPACSTCAPACSTCNYVPQVAYRAVYANVPVTSYRPITSVNPCTGCPTTVLQPVTAYRLQQQLVPYTTYRPVMSSCCAAPTTVGYAPACSTCATGACGVAAPATTYYAPAAVAPAAPCCGNAAANFAPMAAASYATPAPTIYASPSYSPSGSTIYSQGGPQAGQPTGVPSLPPAAGQSAPAGQPSAQPPSTFRQDQPADDSSNPSPSLKPIPDPSAASAPRRTNMILPRKADQDDLTASTKLPGGAVVRHASAKVEIPASTVDDGGWRVAR